MIDVDCFVSIHETPKYIFDEFDVIFFRFCYICYIYIEILYYDRHTKKLEQINIEIATKSRIILCVKICSV